MLVNLLFYNCAGPNQLQKADTFTLNQCTEKQRAGVISALILTSLLQLVLALAHRAGGVSSGSVRGLTGLHCWEDKRGPEH